MSRVPVDVDSLDWDKGDGLLPVIVQDASSARVLMLGYMNRAALELTLSSARVTFFSRRRGQLWVKGETSGHFLQLVDVQIDCDHDSLLVLAQPVGPTCHRQTESCFDRSDGSTSAEPTASELARLDGTIGERLRLLPDKSYTTELIQAGPLRVAQKVGEEGVEVALAGAAQSVERVVAESADLIYHLGVLLHLRGSSLAAVLAELRERRLGA